MSAQFVVEYFLRYNCMSAQFVAEYFVLWDGKGQRQAFIFKVARVHSSLESSVD